MCVVIGLCFLLSRSRFVKCLAALPEVAAAGRGAVVANALLLDNVAALLLATASAAGDEGDDEGDEEEDEASKGGPGTGSPHGPVVVLGILDLVANVAEDDKVADNDDEGDDEGEESGQHGEDAAEQAGDEGEDEANEGKASSNRVEDHDVGQAVGGSRGPSLKAVVIAADDVGENVEDVVANHGAGAAVVDTVGGCVSEGSCSRQAGRGQDIPSAADTPAKGAEGDRGASVGVAAEVDGHHGDAVDDRGGDGADDEEDSSCEQHEATEVVDETQETHFGWCLVVVVVVCWGSCC